MIYKCMDSTCGFLFSRDFVPDRCPSCGKDCIRPATPREIEEFHQCVGGTDKQDRKNA